MPRSVCAKQTLKNSVGTFLGEKGRVESAALFFLCSRRAIPRDA
jgi:hypothetical protein